MKKLATLLLAAAMVLGSVAGAQAIDWKVRGTWQMEFGLYDGLNFTKHAASTQRDPQRKRQAGAGQNGDTFQSGHRINLVLQAVASEHLSGTLHFEIGSTQWGQVQGTNTTRQTGGALGQRAAYVATREAYIDWFVPNTDLRVRMGVQSFNNPSFTMGPLVFGQDVAAVTGTYKFNDNASLTAFWARAANDNYREAAATAAAPNANERFRDSRRSYMDNADAFGLVVPLRFDGFRVTPWGMIGMVGPNVTGTGIGLAQGDRINSAVLNGVRPYYAQTHRVKNGRAITPKQYATAWWAGLTGEVTAVDPFRFAWDANYGSVTNPGVGYLDRSGWHVNLLAEYKLDWGVPGIYFWYGSGDDGNPRNGSEQMPVFDVGNPNSGFSTFGMSGSPQTATPESVMGQNFYTGTWGIGVRIRDMSFIEDLKHTLRVNLFGGTNSPAMAKYILGKKNIGDDFRTVARGYDFNGGNHVDGVGGTNNALGTSGAGMYLTTLDYGVEINLDHSYKIYENLEMIVEMGYIHLWLDQSKSVWGPSRDGNIRGVSLTDAVKASVFFRYSF